MDECAIVKKHPKARRVASTAAMAVVARLFLLLPPLLLLSGHSAKGKTTDFKPCAGDA